MSKFTASNRWLVDEEGFVRNESGLRVVNDVALPYVRTLLMEERDHELGRWRDTELTDYVVYRDKNLDDDDGRSVCILDEKTGWVTRLWESATTPLPPGIEKYAKIARRFFDAHPEHKPLPTKDGLYVGMTENYENDPTNIIILEHVDDKWSHYSAGEWDEESPDPDFSQPAERVAQRWHDEGKLVRLVPEESNDE